MNHDPAIAFDFLRWLRPLGPWLLVAIAEHRPVEGRTVHDSAELAAFLTRHASYNIYYSINPTREELHKKPERVDIARVEFVHVDMDARVPDDDETDLDEHFRREFLRIRAQLENMPAPYPPMDAIVFSGGGFQGLYRLEEPIELKAEGNDERIAAAEDAKLYSMQLEWSVRANRADPCHNIDRIFRLPGTVNWPNSRKIEKGRKPRLAEIVRLSDTAHPLAMFPKATLVQGGGPMSAARSSTKRAKSFATTNVRRWTGQELADKYPKVSGAAWAVVVQGVDPMHPHKHDKDGMPDRSRWVHYACCEMVRGGVPEDVIYAVITDPDHKISASILDKPNIEREATRNIERAQEFAIDPHLLELNDTHAVIENLGGECVVVEMVEDPILERTVFSAQTFGAFKNRYLNRTVTMGVDKRGNAITMPLGMWWLTHPNRRQYKQVVFAPEKETPGMYNLWQGFSVPAVAGDNHASFLAHVRDHVSSGDERIYRYIVAWMARAVQFPDKPGETAIVVRGIRGTGKSVFATMFGKLFGSHFLHIANSMHLVGNFNAQLRDAVVVFADEAFFAGDKKHESVLKQLITERSIVIENKGIDAGQKANFTHVIMASNDQWVVPAGHEERRFLVIDTPPPMEQKARSEYFGRIKEDLEKRDGLSHLLYYLKTYDLTGFDHRDIPSTEALQEQKIMTLHSDQEWLLHKLEDGILLPHHVGWEEPILKQSVIDDYLIYAQRVGNRRVTASALVKLFTRLFPELKTFERPVKVRDANGERIERRIYWKFPELAVCRDAFVKNVLGKHTWIKHDIEDDFQDPESGDPF